MCFYPIGQVVKPLHSNVCTSANANGRAQWVPHWDSMHLLDYFVSQSEICIIQGELNYFNHLFEGHSDPITLIATAPMYWVLAEFWHIHHFFSCLCPYMWLGFSCLHGLHFSVVCLVYW